MKNFIKNTEGAVTVFVTFLLIPAILISGTAVDLTRIYTAQSIIHNANQMAANSVLTQYNALLHDLYGLFGVAENDRIFAKLLDDYIKLTVFGEDDRDTNMGTLQLFYASNLSDPEIHFIEGKDLNNQDVLRRQIEDYMKFRAPVIIVKEFLELIGSNTFKKDIEVIDNKLEIDEAIAELYRNFEKLYEAILITDRCTIVPSDPAGAAGDVSRSLTRIRDEFKKLDDCRRRWEEYKEELKELEESLEAIDDDLIDTGSIEAKIREKSKKMEELEDEYEAILDAIVSRTKGGSVGTGSVQGLRVTIENAILRADRFKPKYDDVVQIAKELDKMIRGVTVKVNELEQRLAANDCNPELKAALTEKSPGSDKSVIQMYRDIVKWDDIEGMAVINKDGGYEYIDITLKDMLRGVIYRSKTNPSGTSLTKEQLEAAKSLSKLSLNSPDSIVEKLASFSDVGYEMPEGYIKFGEYPGRNKEFFEQLKNMMEQPKIPPVRLFDDQEEPEGGNVGNKQRSMIEELKEMADTAYAGLTNNQLGARYINNPPSDSTEKEASGVAETISEIKAEPVANVLSDPRDSVVKAGDYLLLLTYCTSMFSNYATARPDTNGKTADNCGDVTFPVSAAGIPLSPKVNYFFQSEWEYLYNGSEDAGKNLNSVARLIYMVRMICNYISVFSVSDVTQVINKIREVFFFNPPLGLILGEAARAAFVAAESAVDLANLRAGYKVPLIKNGKKGQWICSPKGLAKILSDMAENTYQGEERSDDKGLSYSNYLLLFFLAKGLFSDTFEAELTMRTMNLIEWNVNNYAQTVLCDEETMSGVLSEEDRFRLEDMKTDFSVTTAADMRMLFLSMIVAQNYADSRGLRMPKTMPLTVTDYRGY